MLAEAHFFLHEFEESEAAFDRAISLAPDVDAYKLQKATMYLSWDGSADRAFTVFKGMKSGGYGLKLAVGYECYVFARKYREGIRFLQESPSEAFMAPYLIMPKSVLIGMLHNFSGEAELAGQAFRQAVSQMDYYLENTNGREGLLHGYLALAYAGLGRREEALREIDSAFEGDPLSLYYARGAFLLEEKSIVLTLLGDHEEAISVLEQLIDMPWRITHAYLRANPVWDPLRTNQRFIDLMSTD